MDYRHSEFGRRSPDLYRNSEFDRSAGQDYLRSGYPPQRSRSQTRVDPEYIPTEFSPYGRPLDKSVRSKSLDHRDGFRDDQPYFDAYRSGVNIPIKRERADRAYDYERETYVPLEKRREFDRKDSGERILDSSGRNGFSRDSDSPVKRNQRPLTRSSEWLSRRPYDDRYRNPRDLSRTEDPGRSRKAEYGRSDEFRGGAYNRDEGRDIYRDDPRGVIPMNDGRPQMETQPDISRSGGGHKRQMHSGYHYESHGGGGFSSPSRRTITQQPNQGTAHGSPGHYEYLKNYVNGMFAQLVSEYCSLQLLYIVLMVFSAEPVLRKFRASKTPNCFISNSVFIVDWNNVFSFFE
uniref:RBM6 n=1 Tax=Heterorhabditis bacteriophora TaxID=37862 RepID=A0A1I7WWY5_HETBA